MKPKFPEGFEPTHEGTICGIPIWWDERTFSLVGKNRFYDWLTMAIGPIFAVQATMAYLFSPQWESLGFPLKLRPLPGYEEKT